MNIGMFLISDREDDIAYISNIFDTLIPFISFEDEFKILINKFTDCELNAIKYRFKNNEIKLIKDINNNLVIVRCPLAGGIK